MEAAKKTYHMACKEEKLAAAREANGKTEASVTPDQQKKLHEKVDKCKQDTQKVITLKWPCYAFPDFSDQRFPVIRSTSVQVIPMSQASNCCFRQFASILGSV